MEGRKYNVYLDDVWRWEGSFYRGIMNDKPQIFTCYMLTYLKSF